MAHNKKVVKYRKPLQINIGLIFFVVIFFYMMYFVFQYFTSVHVSVFEVEQGTIAENKIYTGLIIRDETVYSASVNGYINYYIQDGEKASIGDYICTIDENGDYYNQILSSMKENAKLNNDSYLRMEKIAKDYTMNYKDSEFYQMYDFKFDMDAALKEGISQYVLSELDQNDLNSGNLSVQKADQEGIVTYHVDGYEGVTKNSFTSEMFDQSNYSKENLMSKETVNKGEPVFKVVNSENWNIILQIDDNMVKELTDRKTLKVLFKKDNFTTNLPCSILNKDGQNYLVLELYHSMVRFVKERYVEIEIFIKDNTGLKIPNSAKISKDFFIVPKEFISKGGNSNVDGVIKEYKTKDNNIENKFVPVTLFYETEDSYYIADENLVQLDVILKANSNEKLTLSESDQLLGVYSVNKGYAIFRRIEPIAENKEYTIVKTGTEYGISLFDHIALDSKAINENELLK